MTSHVYDDPSVVSAGGYVNELLVHKALASCPSASSASQSSRGCYVWTGLSF